MTRPEIFAEMLHEADVLDEIERLHEEAEELADRARHAATTERAAELREDAKRKVRQAARLRAQIEEA